MGASRVEARRRRTRNRPTRRPNPDVCNLSHDLSVFDDSPITRRTISRSDPGDCRGTLDDGRLTGSLRSQSASGFHYRENFITEADEQVLLDAIGHVFSDFEMRGVVARRRVRSSANRTIEGRRGLFQRSCCRCAPRLRSGLPSMQTRLRWRSSTSIGPARPSAGIATLRSTISSPVFRCCRHVG